MSPTTRLAPLAAPGVFIGRLGRSAGVSAALVVASLALGTGGYHWIAGMALIDAFHQSALIMSGMGPIDETGFSTAAKLFDSFYALFCGMVLLVSTGILFAPVLHRILHRFHLQDAADR
jgi:hypothetical protein